jgi:hypothetical protein
MVNFSTLVVQMRVLIVPQENMGMVVYVMIAPIILLALVVLLHVQYAHVVLNQTEPIMYVAFVLLESSVQMVDHAKNVHFIHLQTLLELATVILALLVPIQPQLIQQVVRDALLVNTPLEVVHVNHVQLDFMQINKEVMNVFLALVVQQHHQMALLLVM